MLFDNYIYKLSIFQHKRDTKPIWKQLPKHELLRWLRFDCRKNKDGPLFAPAKFKQQSSRKDSNVVNVTMLCFDIDNGTKYKEPDHFKYDWISYTTYSHTEEKHKWRLLIPLEKPVISSEWGYAWKAACDLFYEIFPDYKGKKCLDPTCKNSSRMYYFPAYHPARVDSKRLACSLKGKLYTLNYDYIIKEEERKKREVESFLKFQKAKREFERKNRNSHPSHTDLVREAKIGYATSSSDRAVLADRIGCSIQGDRATGFTCPDCGRSDATYFYITPVVVRSSKGRLVGVNAMAYCGHKQSCDMAISLYDLAKFHGLN